MSALLLSALAAGPSGQGALYVDDVFSAYNYTGNGSTQTINNGIDLAGKGGLVWAKMRSNGSATANVLFDTVRGASKKLETNTTGAESNWTPYGVSAFGSTGFTVADDGAGNYITNANTVNYVSWTFRKAPKFFDVVTYTGNGVASRQIAHSLGAQAGFVTVKAISATGDWNSYHRSATGDLKLNLADAQTASRAIITAADANTFTVSGAANTNGVSYVAYLWAHDPSADGIIQCGSFTTDASGNATVNLGWEPQYLLYKRTDSTSDWRIWDQMRGWPMSGSAQLWANLSSAETVTGGFAYPTATGMAGYFGAASATYIYLAVRRPNKPPKTGTQVYNASVASGAVNAGFPVDLHIGAVRAGAANNHAMHARLTGGTRELVTSSTVAEATITDLGFDSMTGLKASLSAGGINHFFRRAPGFFDVVCGDYLGQKSHSLGVTPELIITKQRNASNKWFVWHKLFAISEFLYLEQTAAKQTLSNIWYTPTATTFGLQGSDSNTSVAYLFATLPGISKVGSYTGNGSSQTIDCGFSTGARFFLVKATGITGSWWVYDSARGIVSAADPALQLNLTAAEITSADAVDPTSVGIVVNQEATCSINATGVSYIFLAIA